jgi:2'-5' RNA ligase
MTAIPQHSPHFVRLFVAIGVPPDVAGSLLSHVSSVERQASETGHRWISAADLHITLKFIGTWPESRLGEIQAVLAALPKHGPIDISMEGLGCFPSARYPKVLWAGVKKVEGLCELAGALDDALEHIGVMREPIRLYTPHVTLVRSGHGFLPSMLLNTISGLDQRQHFGRFLAERFHLYRTIEGPQVSTYERVSEVSLLPERPLRHS